MQEKICIHSVVSGLVQGVFYRASTLAEAKKLGLTGWVRNLADERVEVLACGEKAQVEQLVAWLQQGPPRAKVTGVVSDVAEWQEFADFQIT